MTLEMLIAYAKRGVAAMLANDPRWNAFIADIDTIDTFSDTWKDFLNINLEDLQIIEIPKE